MVNNEALMQVINGNVGVGGKQWQRSHWRSCCHGMAVRQAASTPALMLPLVVGQYHD
jgi:hypothetical protein